MTQNQWEKELKRYLSPLSKTEQNKIIDYYREMYGDKLDAGYTEAEILAEFGSPQVCAGRMIAENATITDEEPAHPGNPYLQIQPAQPASPKPQKRLSVGMVVGNIFFTLLIVIPVLAVWVSVIATFAAVGVACIAVAFAGLISPLLSPFYSLLGFSGLSFTANLGLYLASAGAGLMLSVAFYYATKYTAIALAQTLKFVYGRYRQ